MPLLFRFFFCAFLFFCLPVTEAADWKTLDLGNCSIELPSEWYVLDKKTTESFGRFSNNPRKKRLLASQDTANQKEMSMIARVNMFPSTPEAYEKTQGFTNADLKKLTEYFKGTYSNMKSSSLVIKHFYPIQLRFVDGMPALLMSYVIKGERGSDWRVRIFEVYTKQRKYQVNLSMDTQFPENEKVLDKILSTFRIKRE